jgi:DNA-directed RNA polymerase subunit RPC12/RpoP
VEDRSYSYSDDEESLPKRRRLLVIVFIMIIIGALFPLLVFNSPFDTIPDFFFGLPLDSVTLSMLIFVPMLCLFLIAGCGCNRPLTPEEKLEDAKILESMRLHAAPAHHVEGLDRYRCSECEMSFELHNAEPVDEKVVLCPLCGTRLFLG